MEHIIPALESKGLDENLEQQRLDHRFVPFDRKVDILAIAGRAIGKACF